MNTPPTLVLDTLGAQAKRKLDDEMNDEMNNEGQRKLIKLSSPLPLEDAPVDGLPCIFRHLNPDAYDISIDRKYAACHSKHSHIASLM